ncbi:hypothetical protein F4810DRAFT_709121 [Camillea tinctor]|nr:hypothetical protein F4810DRAFT_709121 [Camillea tinctor]
MSPDSSWVADFHAQSMSSKIAWGELKRFQMTAVPRPAKDAVPKPQLLDRGSLLLEASQVSPVSKVGLACDPQTDLVNVISVLENWQNLVFGTSDMEWPKGMPAEGSDQDQFWRAIVNNCVPALEYGIYD